MKEATSSIEMGIKQSKPAQPIRNRNKMIIYDVDNS